LGSINKSLRSLRVSTDQKDRIEGLVRGITGGLYSPNEVRTLGGLDGVKYRNSPRIQAQNGPVDAAASIQSAPTSPAASAVTLDQSYSGAVQRDIEAMTTRIRRPALNGSGRPVVRKNKANALCR